MLAAVVGILGTLLGLMLIAGPGLAVVFGFSSVVLGVAQSIFAYGLWKLRPWAWQLGSRVWAATVVFSILASLAGVRGSSLIVSILVGAAFLYYLNTPAVRRAFARPATGF